MAYNIDGAMNLCILFFKEKQFFCSFPFLRDQQKAEIIVPITLLTTKRAIRKCSQASRHPTKLIIRK